jgi:hypothetical protein
LRILPNFCGDGDGIYPENIPRKLSNNQDIFLINSGKHTIIRIKTPCSAVKTPEKTQDKIR